MRKSALFVAIVVFATIVLSGCGQVIGLVLKADLTVESIQVSEGPDGWTGMSITFGNWGGPPDNDAEYAVYLSYGSQINPAADFLIYRSEFQIDWNSEKIVFLNFETDVDPYIRSNNLFIPEGDLYLGVFVDPDDREAERDELNNDATVGPFLFGGGGTAALEPDAFEPDNNAGMARELVNFAPQYHTFDVLGDEDWFRFDANAGWQIILETRPAGPGSIITDTVIEVYDSGMILITQDDDGGVAPYSYLDFIAPASDTYFVKVRQYYGDIGEYEIERWFDSP
jgi:hypothetical protein